MLDVILTLTFILIIAWCVYSYNKLVRDRNRVLAGWSDIDVQLNRRHDLIPNLVATTKQYASYEQAVLESVTTLRTESKRIASMTNDAIRDKSHIEDDLTSGLTKLMALVENYPELKADTTFKELQMALIEIEEHIQYARRYYNGAVRNLNTRIEQFPDLLIARLFKFMSAEFFQLESDKARRSVEINFE